MKKVFIAYADNNMAYSLKRIGKEAEKIGVFDEIKLYTPDLLPQYIKDSPLMKHSYGGGYWAWKPAIIEETLRNNEDGTIVCYVDAGCSLKPGIEWTLFFELMKEYDTLCFKYRDNMPIWEKFGAKSTKIKCLGKKSALEFLDGYVGTSNYRESNKIWGGLLFFKGQENTLLNQWLDITLNHPEVIIDPSKEEMMDQYPYFALHKHDQVVLTALAFKNRGNCLVLPELSETCGKKVAVNASRFRSKTRNDYIIERFKIFFRKILGNSLYNSIKGILKH